MVRDLSNEESERIKKENNIVDIVSKYIVLKKSGSNYFGNCPFHVEKTSSLSINEKKQMFYCFGCGMGGDLFKFITEIENISFKEAFISLGGKYADKEDFILTQKQNSNKFEAEKKRQTELLWQKQKLELSNLINYYQNLLKELTPMSESWCKCQDYIFYLLYAWEEKYINEKEVNMRGVIARYKKSDRIRDIVGSDLQGTT